MSMSIVPVGRCTHVPQKQINSMGFKVSGNIIALELLIDSAIIAGDVHVSRTAAVRLVPWLLILWLCAALTSCSLSKEKKTHVTRLESYVYMGKTVEEFYMQRSSGAV